MTNHFWYGWRLVKIASQPTARVFRDLRADAGLLAVALLVAYLLRPHGQHGAALRDVTVTVVWGFAALLGLTVFVFVWNLALAPSRMYFETKRRLEDELQEARREIHHLRHAADTDAAIARKRRLVAAQLLRTELRDVRNKVAMLGQSPILADGFQFPASEWAAHRKLIAEDQRLYSMLERAYTEAHRVNEIWRWRRTTATSRLIGVNEEDGIGAVDSTAATAIGALDEIIDEASQ